MRIRPAAPGDRPAVLAVQSEWWGGCDPTSVPQDLFFTYFASTSLIAEDNEGRMAGFLIGFPSGDVPSAAYIHFVGLRPDQRRRGLGTALYARFSEVMGARGVTIFRCVTGPDDAGSIAFHQALGFDIEYVDELVHLRKHVPFRRPELVDPRPIDSAWPEAVWPVPVGTVLAGEYVTLSITDLDSDAAELFAALDLDEVWAHLPERPASAAGMRDLLLDMNSHGQCLWTVRRGREVVGLTSFVDVSPADARLEIGFTAFNPSAWATAAVPECQQLLMAWAFEVAHMGRVQLKTDIRDIHSQVAIDTLGAHFEGALRRFQRREDGSVRDTMLFSVTAEDWPQVKARLRAVDRI